MNNIKKIIFGLISIFGIVLSLSTQTYARSCTQDPDCGINGKCENNKCLGAKCGSADGSTITGIKGASIQQQINSLQGTTLCLIGISSNTNRKAGTSLHDRSCVVTPKNILISMNGNKTAQCSINIKGCPNGIKDLNETDVDCGGSDCNSCEDGKTCNTDSDCVSNICNQKTKICEKENTQTTTCPAINIDGGNVILNDKENKIIYTKKEDADCNSAKTTVTCNAGTLSYNPTVNITTNFFSKCNAPGQTTNENTNNTTTANGDCTVATKDAGNVTISQGTLAQEFYKIGEGTTAQCSENKIMVSCVNLPKNQDLYKKCIATLSTSATETATHQTITDYNKANGGTNTAIIGGSTANVEVEPITNITNQNSNGNTTNGTTSNTTNGTTSNTSTSSNPVTNTNNDAHIKSESYTREFCGLSDQEKTVANNNVTKSESWVDMKKDFLGIRSVAGSKRIEFNQRSNTLGGNREDCKNSLWFDNTQLRFDKIGKNFSSAKDLGKGSIFKVINDPNNPDEANSNQGKSEGVCFSDFLTYASDPNNYNQANNKRLQTERFNENKDKLFVFDIDANSTIKSRTKLAQRTNMKSELTKLGVNNISQPSDLANIITKINANSKSLTNTEVRFLQGAINTLGCDHIMMDGKLGNYTIKSFCTCSVEPPKPSEKPKTCIEVSEIKDNGKSKEFEFGVFYDLVYGNNNINNKCQTPISTEANTKISVGPMTFWCSLSNEIGDYKIGDETPFCCQPAGIKPKSFQWGGKSVTSCCIDPNETEAQKCTNLKDAIKCGVGTDDNACQYKEGEITTSVPICPCESGESRTKGTDGKRECRQITCNDIPNVNDITKISESCTNVKALETEGKTMPKTCDYKGVIGIDISACYPCENGKPAQYHNSKRVCNDCEVGTKKDREKDKCVCDPAQQCCGIKLNTQFPRIGRCIEFGNTNDVQETRTNDYGQGNTTTTVNVLNAFPFLMQALVKIFMTVFLLVSFGMLIVSGVQLTMHGASSSISNGARERITKVAIAIALLGSSGLILYIINPNFFR